MSHTDTSSALTVHEFWERYYYPECETRLARSTVTGYRNAYNYHIRPAFGDNSLNDIQPLEVQTWLDGMTRGAAHATRSIFRGILSRACDLGFIDKNPLKHRYILPRDYSNKRRTQDVYTYSELQDLAELFHGEVFEAAFILSAFGGASREEALSVKVSELEFFDYGERFCLVPIRRGVLCAGNDTYINPRPKNAFRERKLIIPEPYSLRLESLALERLIWLTEDNQGEVMNPNKLVKEYKRWFLRHERRFVPFSNLRNSYATALMEQGVDFYTISKLLGHSQPTTTYKHYTRPQEFELIKVLRGLRVEV